MPNVPQTLPTITITDQATFDRLMAAFNSDPAAYKTWLRNAIKAEVARREIEKIRNDADIAATAKSSELTTFLDPNTTA